MAGKAGTAEPMTTEAPAETADTGEMVIAPLDVDTGDEAGALRLEVAQLRSELSGVASIVLNLRSGGAAPVAPPKPVTPLESPESERSRILAAWNAEPKVELMISPDVNETNAFNKTHEYPPRIFQVSGVQTALPVGKPVQVPASIAALYRHTINPWASSKTIPPVTWGVREAQMEAIK